MWNGSWNQTSHQSAQQLVRRVVSGSFESDCKTVLHIPHTSLIHVAQTHKATISCSHNNLQRIWDVQQNLKLKSNTGTILNLPLSLKHCSSSSLPVATVLPNCPQDSAHVLPITMNNLQGIWDVQQNLKLKSNRGTIPNLALSLKQCSSSSLPVATVQPNCPQDSAHVLPVPPTEQTVRQSPFTSPSHHSPSQLSHNWVDESQPDTDAACGAAGP